MQTACRNAIDWLGSLYNTPWGAANHCNVSLHDFITREWGPGELKGQPRPHCPKYEAPEQNYHNRTQHMFYESAGDGRYAEHVLEMRRWKVRSSKRGSAAHAQAQADQVSKCWTCSPSNAGMLPSMHGAEEVMLCAFPLHASPVILRPDHAPSAGLAPEAYLGVALCSWRASIPCVGPGGPLSACAMRMYCMMRLAGFGTWARRSTCSRGLASLSRCAGPVTAASRVWAACTHAAVCLHPSRHAECRRFACHLELSGACRQQLLALSPCPMHLACLLRLFVMQPSTLNMRMRQPVLQLDTFKGLPGFRSWRPHSHYDRLASGQQDEIFNSSILQAIQPRLDRATEAWFGYSYAKVFSTGLSKV